MMFVLRRLVVTLKYLQFISCPTFSIKFILQKVSLDGREKFWMNNESSFDEIIFLNNKRRALEIFCVADSLSTSLSSLYFGFVSSELLVVKDLKYLSNHNVQLKSSDL